MEKITVVLTTHSRSYLLEYSINCVLAQSYQNFRFIILNSGINPETQRIIDSYDNPKIEHLIVPNTTFAEKLNLGFKMANTKYVTWLCDDDTWKPNFLDTMLGEIEYEEADFAYANYHIKNMDGEMIFRPCLPYRGYNVLLTGNHMGIFWLFKKELFDKVGGFPNLPGEDYCFSLKCAHSGANIIHINKILATYCDNNETTSNSVDFSQLNKHIQAEERRRVEELGNGKEFVIKPFGTKIYG